MEANKNILWKRLACLHMAAVLSLTPLAGRAANLDNEVNAMFTSLGGMGNYTAPGAFRGQTFNSYYGGSLYFRTPAKNYQLASIALPTARAGCGGIDAFMGSFSHISGAELKAMLQSITSALPGIAFQAALEVVSPLLAKITSWISDKAAMINSFNRNSCEDAKSIAGAFAEATGFRTDKACESLAMAIYGDDAAAANQRCKLNKPSVLSTAKTSTDPEVKAITPFVGNMVWKGLQQITTITDAEREMIMSMTGTAVFYDNNNPPLIEQPRLRNMRQLLYGEDGVSSGKIRVTVLKCNEFTECMYPFETTDQITPFTVLSKNVMNALNDAIRNRTAIANNSIEVGFVNNTTIPVWRMLSIGNAVPGSSIAEQMIERYGDIAGADYAYVFLERNLYAGMKAIQRNFKLDKDQQAAASTILTNPRTMLTELSAEMTRLQSKLVSLQAAANELEQTERLMRTRMPAQVMEMLDYAAANTAVR